MSAFRRAAFAFAASLGLVACSQILNWDAEHLPCGDDGAACAAGYSCLPAGVGSRDGCIRDSSLTSGQACFTDAQCHGDLLCFAARCARPCAHQEAFYAADACGPGDVCRPDDAAARGGCAPGDPCTPGALCSVPGFDAVGVCVAISASANLCLQACAHDAGAAMPPCASGEACVPMGIPGERHLVCMPASSSQPGAVCGNPVTAACGPQQVCVTQRCRKLCSVGAADGVCAQGETCCVGSLAPSAELPTTFGYCAARCDDASF